MIEASTAEHSLQEVTTNLLLLVEKNTRQWASDLNTQDSELVI